MVRGLISHSGKQVLPLASQPPESAILPSHSRTKGMVYVLDTCSSGATIPGEDGPKRSKDEADKSCAAASAIEANPYSSGLACLPPVAASTWDPILNLRSRQVCSHSVPVDALDGLSLGADCLHE